MTGEGRVPARDAPTENAGGEREESVIGSEIPRLGFAAFGMTGGGTGDGFPPRREQRKGGRPRGTPLRVVKGSGDGGCNGIGVVYFPAKAGHAPRSARIGVQ